MSDAQSQVRRSLEEQGAEFARRRGLAMPLAGMIVWAVIGIAGAFLPPILAVWSLFIGAGLIAYFGVVLSRFTGENFMDKNKPKNAFDNLFFHCIAMALLVYAIAIPFYRMDYTSLPLTVGILAGLIALARSQPEHCRYNGVSCAALSIVRQALSGDRFARGVHPIDDGFSV